MNTHDDRPPTNPISNFTNCHVGITAGLHKLRELPAMVEAASQARALAVASMKLFDLAVREHHAEEERELFPAVLASAKKGEEHARVQAMVDRLTAEHRQIEAAWMRLEPAVKAVSRGHEARVDADALALLVQSYLGHARYEEEAFLPLSEEILGRNGNHMAALGLSLHIRHHMDEVLSRVGARGV